MVCIRCKMVVKAELDNMGLAPSSVDLGEVEIMGDMSKDQLMQLDFALKPLDFEIL